MFNDLREIKDHLAIILSRLDSVERNVNGVSDELNEIMDHSGLEIRTRRGKRHKADILAYVRWILHKDPELKTEGVFTCISGFLAANEGKENKGIWSESDRKEYEQWRMSTLEEWREQIELERQTVKEERAEREHKKEP